WIANLHSRTFLQSFFIKFRGSHRRAVNPIATSFCADVQHRIAHAGSFAKEDLILSHQAQRERIDERIQGVGVIEGDFASDGRHTKRISVMSDAGYAARE